MKLEEFRVGDVYTTDCIVMTEADIIEFATRYDPHYFHIDQEAARQSLFGHIVASGMHSLALLNAAFVRMNVLGRDIQGGIHMDANWTMPVFDGDEIYGEFIVMNTEVSKPQSRTGLLTLQCIGKKVSGETFATSTIQVLMSRNM